MEFSEFLTKVGKATVNIMQEQKYKNDELFPNSEALSLEEKNKFCDLFFNLRFYTKKRIENYNHFLNDKIDYGVMIYRDSIFVCFIERDLIKLYKLIQDNTFKLMDDFNIQDTKSLCRFIVSNLSNLDYYEAISDQA